MPEWAGGKELKWGDFPGACSLCAKEAGRFGTLIDPNGHIWYICADCINSLWDERQEVPEITSSDSKVNEAIETLREALRERGI